jgi:hypothetical protein
MLYWASGRLIGLPRAAVGALECTHFTPKLGHRAMYVIEFFARRIAEHLAIEGRHLLLREA